MKETRLLRINFRVKKFISDQIIIVGVDRHNSNFHFDNTEVPTGSVMATAFLVHINNPISFTFNRIYSYADNFTVDNFAVSQSQVYIQLLISGPEIILD